MGKLLRAMRHSDPVLDYGWRVSLFPPGTTLVSALAQEAVLQGELGRALVAGSGTVLPSYLVRTFEDSMPDSDGSPVDPDADHGWRDVTRLGTVPVRFRVTGPGIHTDS